MTTTIKIDGIVHTLKEVVRGGLLENCTNLSELDPTGLQMLADAALYAEELEEEIEELKSNFEESLTEIKENIFALVAILEADLFTDEPLEAMKEFKDRYKQVTEHLDDLDTKLAEFINGDGGDTFQGIDV